MVEINKEKGYYIAFLDTKGKEIHDEKFPRMFIPIKDLAMVKNTGKTININDVNSQETPEVYYQIITKDMKLYDSLGNLVYTHHGDYFGTRVLCENVVLAFLKGDFSIPFVLHGVENEVCACKVKEEFIASSGLEVNPHKIYYLKQDDIKESIYYIL